MPSPYGIRREIDPLADSLSAYVTQHFNRDHQADEFCDLMTTVERKAA